MKPFIFVDDDKESDTYGQFCVIISETESYGRFSTFREAVEFLENY